MNRLFRKQRWDRQPTAPVGVLLVSDGTRSIGSRAVARAAALAGSDRVAVLVIAKIYGTSFGLPAPGLMPTREELQERLGWVRDAIQRLQRKGIEVDGQVAQTRRISRTIARVARARSARVVVIESFDKTRWRAVVEGDVASTLSRTLPRRGIEVELVPASGRASGAASSTSPASKR